jgi:hypothetical protein
VRGNDAGAAMRGGSAATAPDRNQQGRARAMTVLSPVRPWYRFTLRRPWNAVPGGVLLARLVFLAARALPGRTETIRELSFIHFARWAIIDHIPNSGQPPERLDHPLLLFESNYNGTFDQYIDAFASILTAGMTAIWGTSYGFPGPQPATPFKQYIAANEFVADHYYSAYPQASTTMIKAALRLRQPLKAFSARASALKPERFAADYGRLLTEMQADL